MQTLPSLPFELFEEILRLAIDVHPARHAIPRVNSTWANVSLPILHSRIRFTSLKQLGLFSVAPGELCCEPREVEVLLSGITEGSGLPIYHALKKCQRCSTMSPSNPCCRGVTVLRLCLDSNLSNYDVQMIGNALCEANPEVFVWKGPDPNLYSLTGITAVKLSEAISIWASLRRLELSNIVFLNSGLELSRALTTMCNCPSFPFNPPSTNGVGPVQIVISRAVFMLPFSVLHIALGVPALRELRLVDVYQHSGGLRLQMNDVEGSLSTSKYMGDASEHDCLKRLREVVSIEEKEWSMVRDEELQDQ